MEPVGIIAIMIFWIVIASIIGGVILLRPLSKRLGSFLDDWIAIRRQEQGGSSELLRDLAERLAVLEDGQRRLLEHQEFIESLAEGDEAKALSLRE